MKMEEYQVSARSIFEKYISKVAIFIVGVISIIFPLLKSNKGQALDYIEIIIFSLTVSAVMFVYYFVVKWLFISLPPKLFRPKDTKSDSD